MPRASSSRARPWARVVAALAVLAIVAASGPGEATTYIRDTEIETTIRDFSAPVLRAAGLSPDDVHIYLIKDDSLNAFVAGGLNIFLHTGLIKRAEDPGQLIGVIAHEAGHIAGGHLSRIQDELSRASIQAIIATVLGAAAGVATGRGDVAVAASALGQHAAERNILSYSRAQESAADQAAIRYLEATGQSARGLMDFLKILEDQELLSPALQDPYLRTHPITRERVDTVRRHVENSRYSEAKYPAEWHESHARMVAKLDGFLDSPGRTLRNYPESDQSIPARYARAIAHHKRADLPVALELIDGLIEDHPDDPFCHELKGQILFERGEAARALPAYVRANELLPGEPLLQIALAQVAIEQNDREWTERATNLLERAVQREDQNARAWRLLGVAHGRLGNMGRASLALAEEALLRDEPEDAMRQANRAQREMTEGSSGWLRAEDVHHAAERAIEERRRRR